MKININNLLFYVSYSLFLSYTFLGEIEAINEVLKWLTYVALFVIIIKFIANYSKYSIRQFLILVLLIIASSVSAFLYGNLIFLKLILLIIAAKDIPIAKMVKFDMLARILLFLIIATLSVAGVSTDVVVYYGDRIRHSYGFSNPNVLGMHIYLLCLDILYTYANSKKCLHLLICGIITAVAYSLAGSRTALIMTILTIICFLLHKHNKEIFKSKKVLAIIRLAPTIVIGISFIVVALYMNRVNLGVKINTLFSGRLDSMEFFIKNFKITLFGNNIGIIKKSCDMLAIYLLYSYGMTGLLLFDILTKKTIDKIIKQHNFPLAIILTMLCIYGFSEKLWLFPDHNIFMMSYTLLLSKENR